MRRVWNNEIILIEGWTVRKEMDHMTLDFVSVLES